jgi:hypothetical protein
MVARIKSPAGICLRLRSPVPDKSTRLRHVNGSIYQRPEITLLLAVIQIFLIQLHNNVSTHTALNPTVHSYFIIAKREREKRKILFTSWKSRFLANNKNMKGKVIQ